MESTGNILHLIQVFSNQSTHTQKCIGKNEVLSFSVFIHVWTLTAVTPMTHLLPNHIQVLLFYYKTFHMEMFSSLFDGRRFCVPLPPLPQCIIHRTDTINISKMNTLSQLLELPTVAHPTVPDESITQIGSREAQPRFYLMQNISPF